MSNEPKFAIDIIWKSRLEFLSKALLDFEKTIEQEQASLAGYLEKYEKWIEGQPEKDELASHKLRLQVLKHFQTRIQIDIAESEGRLDTDDKRKKILGPISRIVRRLRRYYIDDASFARLLLDDFTTKKRIKYPDKFPWAYVMNTLLTHVIRDFQMIQQSFIQFASYDKVQPGDSLPQYDQSVVLYQADTLSAYAILPAANANYIDSDIVVISHFQSRVRVRIIPYYKALILGIPYTTYQFSGFNALSYLMIPHEMGHHLYWNGLINDTPIYKHLKMVLLQETLKDKGDWRWHWLEELFADLYGCLIAGPVSVSGTKSLLLTSSPEHFHQDTGVHPIPELRPLIQAEMLRRIKTKYGAEHQHLNYEQAPGVLETNWLNEERVRDNLFDSEPAITFNIIGVDAPMKAQEIIDQLNPVIDAILDEFGHLVGQLTPWSEDGSSEFFFQDRFIHLVYRWMDTPPPKVSKPNTMEPLAKRYWQLRERFLKTYNREMKNNDVLLTWDEYKKKNNIITSGEWLGLIFIARWSDWGGGTLTTDD